MRPRIMLFDEVTSALDPELVGEVLRAVRDLAHETTMTMLIVTHEMSFAGDISDRVIFMDHGRIVEDGPPGSVLRAPTNERTRDFLRAIVDR
jgi:polar amino acid transport system ATP-binding protein